MSNRFSQKSYFSREGFWSLKIITIFNAEALKKFFKSQQSEYFSNYSSKITQKVIFFLSLIYPFWWKLCLTCCWHCWALTSLIIVWFSLLRYPWMSSAMPTTRACSVCRKSSKSRTTTWVVFDFSGPEYGKCWASISTRWAVIRTKISPCSLWTRFASYRWSSSKRANSRISNFRKIFCDLSSTLWRRIGAFD